MDKHVRDTMQQWALHPGWEIWNQRDIEARDKFLADMAAKLFSMPKDGVIDQLELAFQRGRWRGRREILNEIRLAGKPTPKEGE